MLFDTYTSQAVQASLDNTWLKTQVISNNIANVDTPGFKASTVSFEEVLQGASMRVQNHEGQEVSETTRSFTGSSYFSHVNTDDTTSVRVDGNNVSMEKEQSELWKAYAQYNYLIDRISGHYNNISAAISGMRT